MLGHPFHADQFPVFDTRIDTAMAMRIADRAKSFQDGHLDTSVIVIRINGSLLTMGSKFTSLFLK
jgi:hypothetical protein